MTTRRRVAMVVHAVVPDDPRVRRQADALLAAGHAVDIVALRDPGQATEEVHDSLRIVRLPVRRRSAGFAGHLAEYLAFTALATISLARLHARRRYHVVQVHTLPDFLIMATLPLKLAGVPVLLDLHEDMPAFFADRFRSPVLRPLARAVGATSRWSAMIADHALTVHEPLRALAVTRGLDPADVTVVMNSADESLFDPSAHPRRPFMEDGVLRLVHHSSIQRIYGLDVAIEAVALLRSRPDAPPIILDVYGDGPHRPALEAAIARHDVEDAVRLHGRVAMEELPALLARADVGIVPSLPEPYLQLSLSTKLLEYVALGVPVVASDLATFRQHFGEDAVAYVPGGDAGALADALAAVSRDSESAARRAAEARRQAEPYAWGRQREVYLDVIERLSGRRTAVR